MGRMSGSWLEGPPLSRAQPAGVRLGLPADGAGSVATFGRRLGGFAVDAVVANLLAGLPMVVGWHYGPAARNWVVLAAFLLQEFVLVSIAGQTIGKRLLSMHLVRLDGGRPQPGWVLLRTLLLGLLVPALIWDRDSRGLHDRAAGTMLVLVLRGNPAGGH